MRDFCHKIAQGAEQVHFQDLKVLHASLDGEKSRFGMLLVLGIVGVKRASWGQSSILRVLDVAFGAICILMHLFQVLLTSSLNLPMKKKSIHS